MTTDGLEPSRASQLKKAISASQIPQRMQSRGWMGLGQHGQHTLLLSLVPHAAFSGLQAEDSFGKHQLTQGMGPVALLAQWEWAAVGREVMMNGGVVENSSKGFFSKKRQQKESWKMMTAEDCALWRSLPATKRALAFCAALLSSSSRSDKQGRGSGVPKKHGQDSGCTRAWLLALSFPSQKCKQEKIPPAF